MKTDLRYQNGFLYENHGAWYVRYYERTSKVDGSCQLNHASKHLGRCKDFRNISDVELCRALFMQTVNRDRLSANSRITLTAFVEGAYFRGAQDRVGGLSSHGLRKYRHEGSDRLVSPPFGNIPCAHRTSNNRLI